jgi:DNA polymerase bacteriophage-type
VPEIFQGLKMRTLSFDYETFSKADLKKGGLSKYAKDHSTEVLMCAWQIDSGPVHLWVPAEDEDMPEEFLAAMLDPKCLKRAWNAQFERVITKHVLKIDVPINQWRCTMALAYSLSLPGSLGLCGLAVGLPADKAKDTQGKALIRTFCIPRKPTKTKAHDRCTAITDPVKWETFKEYCRQDVVAERAIYNRIRKWNMSDEELDTWFMDQEINDAGIPINRRMVTNAQALIALVTDDRMGRLRGITGLENPNSTMQLLAWCIDHGYVFDDMKKGHVERAAKDAKTSDQLREVLEMRLEISKSSVKKYTVLENATDDDGNLRYCFQYGGASRTLRWGGRNYQPQNLARPTWYLEAHQERCARSLETIKPEVLNEIYDKPMDLLSTCVRPVVQAGKGFVFVDADLNAIENRVLGWVCDEQKILDVFRNKRDPYIDFATYMFNRTYDDLYHDYKVLKNKGPRQTAKPGVLGCGYQLGVGEQHEDPHTGEITGTGLLGYALNMGISLTPEESAHAVTTWRETYSEVVKYWKTIENAAKTCINSGKTTSANDIEFSIDGPFLKMRLPSERSIFYCNPSIKMVKTKFGARENISYRGVGDNNQWGDIKTYGGKLVENAVQAISRDLLVHGMKLARAEGLDIRLHVHDQICARVPEKNADRKLRTLIECMSETPSWAPGLPLAAEGSINQYFMKD